MITMLRIVTQSMHIYMQIIIAFTKPKNRFTEHYSDFIMSVMASQIIDVPIVYSTVWSGADQRKHQSSASLAFVRGLHRGSVKFPAQRASNAENVSIWWRHHEFSVLNCGPPPNITNATTNADNYTYGALAYYECDPGLEWVTLPYVLLTCNCPDEWSGPMDNCTGI